MRPSWISWLIVVGIFLGIFVVWGLARWINPYEADGTPRLRSNHEQLGLPPCQFLQSTGFPCPSCGLTSSFALLAHGDPVPAFLANPAGPLIFLLTIWVWIWSFLCLVRQRIYWSARQEMLLVVAFAIAFFLMIGRWGMGFLFP